MKSAKSPKSHDSEDEVVLRLSLKGIRERRDRQKAKKEGLRVETGVPHSVSPHTSKKIVQQRGLTKKMACFNDNSDDHMSTAGSVAYSVYSRSSRVSKIMGEEAAINRLILEDLWSDSPATVESGLKKLSGILGIKKSSENSSRHRDMIFRAGGHLAIVQAMKKHKNSNGVQGEGCRALGIAAEDIANSENENAIATVGGIDAILTAMRAFRDDEQIQDFGCGALQNLTGMDATARLLLDREGLTAVLIAMRNFPDSTLIQESACWTIVNLCQQRENRQKIEKARCLSCIASVIDNHPRSDRLKLAAEEALNSVLSLIGSRKSATS